MSRNWAGSRSRLPTRGRGAADPTRAAPAEVGGRLERRGPLDGQQVEVVAGHADGREGPLAQLLAAGGRGEGGPPGHRGHPHDVLVAEGEPGRGDPAGQGAEPLLDLPGAGLRQQHEQPALAVDTRPLQRLGGVGDQLGDLGRDLGRGPATEAVEQPGHLLELDDAEPTVAAGAVAALELAAGLVDERGLGEQTRAQVTADEGGGDRGTGGLGPHPGGELHAGDGRGQAVVGAELQPGQHVVLVAAREQQHRDGAAGTRLAQPPQQVETVGAVAAHGGDHDVGAQPREGRDRVLVGTGAHDDEAARPQGGPRLVGEGAVVDEQHGRGVLTRGLVRGGEWW